MDAASTKLVFKYQYVIVLRLPLILVQFWCSCFSVNRPQIIRLNPEVSLIMMIQNYVRKLTLQGDQFLWNPRILSLYHADLCSSWGSVRHSNLDYSLILTFIH
jgi:hypothetical protein